MSNIVITIKNMLALPNIADLRMQQQIAHELYRQQIMQRLPGMSSAFECALPTALTSL